MHGLFENIAPSMLRHWSGTFFKDDQDSSSDHILSNNNWIEMGRIMEKNRRNMPFDFGRPLSCIQSRGLVKLGGIIFTATFTRPSSRKVDRLINNNFFGVRSE